MSQHDPSIPTAILVPKKPRQRVKLPLIEGDIPWMKVAIIGSIAWVVITLVVVFFFAIQPQVQREDVDLRAARPVRAAAPDQPAPKPKAEDVPAKDKEAVLPADEQFVECARIGTDVRFMKQPVAAFKRAKEEGKMVFMVHLSGNLDDKDFT